MSLRLLAVHAHPDDESSKGSATSAYYRSRGTEVMIVTCTGGERGDVLNESLEARAHAERDLPGLRRTEMAAAAAVMGVQHRWLGYQDSGMASEDGSVPPGSFADIPLESSAAPLVRIIREYRPQVLVTYDENGGYPHPDHIRSHEVSLAAFRAAADPSAYPELGPAWQISKLYYDRIFNSRKIVAVRDHVLATDPESPLIAELGEISTWLSETPYLATTRVPVGEFFGARDDALRAHASQVAPDSRFFFWPNEVQKAAWPYEDFQLIESTVPVEQDEDDLFAGIEDDA